MTCFLFQWMPSLVCVECDIHNCECVCVCFCMCVCVLMVYFPIPLFDKSAKSLTFILVNDCSLPKSMKSHSINITLLL